MNDDATATSDTARLPTFDDNDSDAGSHDEVDPGAASSHQGPLPRRRRSRNGRRRSSSQIRRAKAGIAKKLEFFTHLMSSLDVVVFAELCVLYYMEYVSSMLDRSEAYFSNVDMLTLTPQSCSFARLMMRSLVQYMYLTPKPEDFLKLMPAPRPQMYTIFGSNILCILLHLILALPEASETMRGYLHGGVIIDFIGQQAPTSRLSLLLLDCMVLALQCVMCAVWLEKDRLKKIEATLKIVSAGGLPKSSTNTAAPLPTVTAAMDVTTGAQTSAQDLDSEERGILRDDPLSQNETNDIEMRPLINPRSPAGADGDGASTILEARYQRILNNMGGSNSTEGPDTRPSLLDVMISGNGLLANFHVVHSIRTLVADNANDPVAAVGYPIQLTGYGARFAALAAQSQAQLERRAGRRP